MRIVYIIYIALYIIYILQSLKIVNLTFSLLMLNFRCARVRKEEKIGTS